jgi:NAD-dependent deacetylase
MESLIERAARYIVESSYAIALTGAGMSTESGIPDFRGPQGVWTKNPEAERRAYLGWQRFQEDPKAWWEERMAASTSALGNLVERQPNAGHYALVELEKMGVVKCLVTQNVDGLHEKAGQQRLMEYHGSFAKLRCIECNARFRRDQFDLQGLLQKGQLPPTCPSCGGIVKTDGVGFGEPIPSDVAQGSLEEAWKCDLMLICGTSAVVYPFANLPRVARQRGVATIIEINAEPTPLTHEGVSDFIIQGKTGEVLPVIVEEVKKLRR